MKHLLYLPLAVCTLLAPIAANLPVGPGAPATSQLPVRADELDVRGAAALGALRAGRVAAPAQIGAEERAELRAASSTAPTLGAMRAGMDGPTNNQWKWIGIGAAVVLVIVLL
jgi:hypothetical protein